MKSLAGRIALVTGGGRGIGKAISLALAAEGATIAINYRRDKESAEETMREILDLGGLATIHQGSNDIPEENVAMVKDILSVHDGIDIAVLNGGIASKGRSVIDTEAEELWQLVATHALGPHQLCRALLPSMRTRGRGDIVFISSVATSGMSANGAPYNMGKAAMEALALTLAKEERPNNIRVNIVAPGLVETDMGVRLARAMTGRREMEDLRSMDEAAPFGRVCQPEDIANAVLWFCSPSASYITGQRIQVDGGGSTMRVGQ
jgi:NAD(P)-dependent dehydrogenase (short-subunit alcohol dehydrogenase family)